MHCEQIVDCDYSQVERVLRKLSIYILEYFSNIQVFCPLKLTVYICKNSMLEKYVFVGKSVLHFVYHIYLKRPVFERTKFFNGQNFIKKFNENVSSAIQNNC